MPFKHCLHILVTKGAYLQNVNGKLCQVYFLGLKLLFTLTYEGVQNKSFISLTLSLHFFLFLSFLGLVMQEEIRFMINPELIAGMLFMASMEGNEAIEIVGAERFSSYIG